MPRGLDYSGEQNFFWALTELPMAALLRDVAERRLLSKDLVVWRNFEASKDTRSLEPRTRRISTDLRQEHFVPVRNFLPFLRQKARILKARIDPGNRLRNLLWDSYLDPRMAAADPQTG